MTSLHAIDPALIVTGLALLHGLAALTWLAARYRLVLGRRRHLPVASPAAAVAEAGTTAPAPANETGRRTESPAASRPSAASATRVAEAKLLDDLERWRRSIRHDAA